METLPIELQEQIFAHLIPHQNLKELVTLPISSRPQRTDIYNLRLTSRRIHMGAWQSFAVIVQDVPSGCREKSLKHMTALVELPNISNALTCLTLNTCKLFLTEKTEDEDDEMKLRDTWLQENLCSELESIIRKAPRLRQLVCVVEAIRGCSMIRGQERNDIMARRVALGTDPMHLVQRALATTKLKDTLETIVFLNTSHEGLRDQDHSYLSATPMEFPSLQHLTVALTARRISDCAIRAPHLTSFHVVLDHYSFSEEELMYENEIFPEIHPGLHHYTISGNNGQVTTNELLECIWPLFGCDFTLPRLTIRDMVVVDDISYYVPRLRESGRIGLLVFQNVTYCFTDQITLSGPSEPRELDQGWKLLTALLQRADSSRIEPSTR